MKYYFLFFLFWGTFIWAQSQSKPKKIKYLYSDKLQTFRDKYIGQQLFSGKVAFEHNGAKLYADSVLFDEKNNHVLAFSNVKLISKQNTLVCDKLNYSGNTQKAVATGNVVLRDPDQTLYTDKLEYDRKTNKAYYNTGGTIVSSGGDDTLTSQIGIYDITKKTNTFEGDVNMTNKDYFIDGRNIVHHTQGNWLEFTEETLIQSRKNPTQFIKTTKGKYYTNKKEAFLENRSTVYSDGKSITADDLYYNQATGFGKGTGKILIDDPKEKRFIKGDYGEVYSNMDSSFVTGDAVAVKAFEKDSLYLHADTLLANKFNEKSRVRAFRQAKFFKSNLQGKADSIAFEETDGKIHFYYDPVIWSGYRQVTGDTIVVYTNTQQERMDSIQVNGHAFAASKVDSLIDNQFHQLKSRKMLGIFTNEQLDWIQAEGNAQSIFYAYDENKEKGTSELIGLNHSDCGIAQADVEERAMNVVACKINADSDFYPPSKITPEIRFLKDFIWREKERIKRWQDIFIEDERITRKPKNNLKEKEEILSELKDKLPTRKGEKAPQALPNNSKPKRELEKE